MGTGIAQYIRVREREKRASLHAPPVGRAFPDRFQAANARREHYVIRVEAPGCRVSNEKGPRVISEFEAPNAALCDRRASASDMTQQPAFAFRCARKISAHFGALVNEQSSGPTLLNCVSIVSMPQPCISSVSDLSSFPRPVILTFRPSEQGGYRNLTREEREAFWKTQAHAGEAVWWDVEGDLVHDLSPDWSRIIVSHHDFSGVPTIWNRSTNDWPKLPLAF